MDTTLKQVQQSIKEQLSKSSWFYFPTGLVGEKENVVDLTCAVIGLNEEAGEVAGLLKKQVFRGKEKGRDQWLSELGDVLWYLIATATFLNFTLDEIWQYNCDKLEARRKAGVKGKDSWEG